MNDIAVSVRGLTKDFEVYARPIDIAIEALTRRRKHETFRALDNVTFDVKRGQVLGIVGANGAGKSTLLKIITGVLDPTDGYVETRGRVSAILELGLGFNPELSGRENVFLSGLLYGISNAELNARIDEIIAFSGLGDFIERPVKTYSSGMHSRLAFSIATAAESEILIIDEALAAGDAMFVQKSYARIRKLCSGGRTVLLVSHGTSSLAQLCSEAVWLEQGRVRMAGRAMDVIQAYDIAAHAAITAQSTVERVEDAAFTAGVGAQKSATAFAQDLPTEPDAPISHDDAGNEQPGAPDEALLAQAGTVTEEKPAASEVDGQAPEQRHPGCDEASAAKGSPYAADGQGSPVSPQADDTVSAATIGHALRSSALRIDHVMIMDGRGGTTTRLNLLEPFSIEIAYHCPGDLPDGNLAVAIAVNRAQDLAPIAQFFTQNIMPDEDRDSYSRAPFRSPAFPQGSMTLRFRETPFRAGEYVLSVGLLKSEPANWIFYEYRHFFYRFSVIDRGMEVGADIFLRPEIVHQARPCDPTS